MQKPGARTRAPRLPAEERRHQIVAAAIDVFAETGYAAAGTAAIAAAAGIGEPTIYRYFANKRDLYIAALTSASDDILAAWARVTDAAPDPLTALRQIGVWYYQRLQQNPALLLLRSRAVSESLDATLAAVVREQYLRIVRFVEGRYAEAGELGLIAPGDAAAYTWLYMAVGSLLDQSVLLGLGGEMTTEQVLRMAQFIQPGGRERSN